MLVCFLRGGKEKRGHHLLGEEGLFVVFCTYFFLLMLAFEGGDGTGSSIFFCLTDVCGRYVDEVSDKSEVLYVLWYVYGVAD